MHAERFKVRSWLETPARWLAWAVDSGGNLKDATWNLKRFWETLQPLKTTPRDTWQWAEILLLDSRAQSLHGHHLLIQAALKAGEASVYAVDMAWARSFTPGLGVTTLLPKVREFLAKNDPRLQVYQASIRKLHDQAQEAFRQADQMAAQAKQAMASVRVDATLAGRAQGMAQHGQTITRLSKGQTEQRVFNTATSAGLRLDLPNLVTLPIGGVPLWLWAAGGLLLALAVTAGPTVFSVNRARRMAA